MSIKIRQNSNIQWRNELTGFFRFGIVGLSSTFLDLAILSALKYFFGWPTVLANFISYSCGTINSYNLSRHWVYSDSKGNRSFRQLFRFISINVVGLILNMVLLLLLEIPFGMLLSNAAYSYIPAKIGATIIVFLWNFFANRFWTFSQSEKLRPRPQKAKPAEVEVYEQTAA